MRKDRILGREGRLLERVNLIEDGIWNFFLSFSRAGHSKMWEMFRGESRSQKSQDKGKRFDRIWECVRQMWSMRSLVRIISCCRESWFEEGHSKGWGLKFASLWIFGFSNFLTNGRR